MSTVPDRLNVVREEKDKALFLRLSGAVIDGIDMNAVIGPINHAEVHVNCAEIKRLNSIGVKGWVKFFESLKTKGTKLFFSDCSIPIVEQLNMISNFFAHGQIESVQVPYLCAHCSNAFNATFSLDKIKSFNLNLPEMPCVSCKKPASFDDVPEDYFQFLER
jgi:hypothetical protein